jgi:hypothetical protein
VRATKAYIASLGTTGVLLGASILMLAVVSAVVAFNRWPSGTVSTRVQTLTLEDHAGPIRVSSRASGIASPAARAAAAAGRVTPAGVNLQRVADERVSAPRTTDPGTTGANPANPAQPAIPAKLPPLPSPGPIDLSSPNPDQTRNQLADSAQQATDSLGGSVSGVNESAGQAVSTAGQTATDEVRQLPLPGPLFP